MAAKVFNRLAICPSGSPGKSVLSKLRTAWNLFVVGHFGRLIIVVLV